MKEALREVLGGALALEERNIEESEELLRRYLLEIPVLLYGEEELVRGKPSRAELRLALARVGLL
jgi:hypothetical protein